MNIIKQSLMYFILREFYPNYNGYPEHLQIPIADETRMRVNGICKFITSNSYELDEILLHRNFKYNGKFKLADNIYEIDFQNPVIMPEDSTRAYGIIGYSL